MKKHKQNEKKFSRNVIIALVFLIATVVILTFAIAIEKGRLDTLYDQQTNQYMEDYYRTARITFCYDNKVYPCNDEQITLWNNAHPDDKFSLSTPKLPSR